MIDSFDSERMLVFKLPLRCHAGRKYYLWLGMAGAPGAEKIRVRSGARPADGGILLVISRQKSGQNCFENNNCGKEKKRRQAIVE